MVAKVIKVGRYSTAGALLAVAALGSIAFAAGFTSAPMLTIAVAGAGAVAGAFAVLKTVV